MRTRPSRNGSSIAFIAEHDGKRVLFGADAHADVLLASLKRGPLAQDDTLGLDVFKVAHHGSKRNVSRELVEALPAKRYLISTSGAIFGHPNPEAIARIAVFGPKKKALELQLPDRVQRGMGRRWPGARLGAHDRYGNEKEGLLVRL